MRDDRLYLVHMTECIAKIEQYTAGGRDVFIASSPLQDAVIRNFEIIGEAAKRVSLELKQRYPQIAWRAAAGFRDVLIHNYMGVDTAQVWQTVEQHVPVLKQQIIAILTDLDAQP